MKSDIWLLVWFGAVALFGYIAKLKKPERVFGNMCERYTYPFAIIAFLPIIIFVVFGEIRSDVSLYLIEFDKYNLSFSDVLQGWWTNKGSAFAVVEIIIKHFFGNNWTAFRLIICLIQSIPLIVFFRKYSEDYLFSVFLFITSGYYDSWMMNGLRQCIATCIITFAVPFLVKKKYFSALIVVLIALAFHQSALLMIPTFLVVLFEPWTKKEIVLLILLVIVLWYFIYHTDLVNEEFLKNDGGSHPLRIIFSAIPVVVCFVARRLIQSQNNALINICVNISAVNVMLYFVATFTSGILVGRLPGYTNLFNFVLIPFLCNRVFNEKTSKYLRMFFVFLYLSYFVFWTVTGVS